MRCWWRNQPITVAGSLKGSQRIVYEEIKRMLADHHNPSVTALSEQTGYHFVTIWRALTVLRERGLLKINQAKRGTKADYIIIDL